MESGDLFPAIESLEPKLRFDEDYKSRKGFRVDFLDGYSISLPTVTDTRKLEMIRTSTGRTLTLKYHHFSLAINMTRRFQMWSAVNVNYSATKRDGRSRKDFGDDDRSWRYDSRIGKEYQVSNEQFYKPAKKTDRGHMIRREDNCWGNTPLEIEYANADTFHWTNCTPQHQAFNQSGLNGLWGRLEEHIRQNLAIVNNKACIFAGPVLDNQNDPAVNFGKGNIQYPVRFWKVITVVDEHEGLMTYGFVLDQSALILNLGLDPVDVTRAEAIDFTKFKTQQVSLRLITQLTGVNFASRLYDADVLKQPVMMTAPVSRQITSVEDIQLHPYDKRGVAV